MEAQSEYRYAPGFTFGSSARLYYLDGIIGNAALSRGAELGGTCISARRRFTRGVGLIEREDFGNKLIHVVRASKYICPGIRRNFVLISIEIFETVDLKSDRVIAT